MHIINNEFVFAGKTIDLEVLEYIIANAKQVDERTGDSKVLFKLLGNRIRLNPSAT